MRHLRPTVRLARLGWLLISAMCLPFTAAADAPPLDEERFTIHFESRLRAARDDLNTTRDGALEVTVTDPDGATSTAYLHRAYSRYLARPGDRDVIVSEFVDAVLDTLATGARAPVLMPLVAARGDIDALLAQAASVPGTRAPELLWEPLAGELVVLYVLDFGERIQYMDDVELGELGLLRGHLARVAKRNLRNALPTIEVSRAQSLWRVAADGTYESSLLLLDELWTRKTFPVQGEIVAFPIARGVLVVTGTEDEQGLRDARSLAARSWSNPIIGGGVVRRGRDWAALGTPPAKR